MKTVGAGWGNGQHDNCDGLTLPVPALTYSADLDNIRDYVKGGGALVMLGGRLSLSSGGYAGTPVAEVLPGYLLKERLVRAAMVVVAQKPPQPVEQKVQPIAQPAWVEMQSVRRVGVGISTDSISSSSCRRHSCFSVPSLDTEF